MPLPRASLPPRLQEVHGGRAGRAMAQTLCTTLGDPTNQGWQGEGEPHRCPAWEARSRGSRGPGGQPAGSLEIRAFLQLLHSFALLPPSIHLLKPNPTEVCTMGLEDTKVEQAQALPSRGFRHAMGVELIDRSLVNDTGVLRLLDSHLHVPRVTQITPGLGLEGRLQFSW